MHLSGNPKTKQEAMRWVRIGIELSVINPQTDRPIGQHHGFVTVTGPGWIAQVTLHNGIVTKMI